MMEDVTIRELIVIASDLDGDFENTEYSRGMVELIAGVVHGDNNTEELVMELIAAQTRYQKLLAEKNELATHVPSIGIRPATYPDVDTQKLEKQP